MNDLSHQPASIALFTGDPAGIGPELVEKLLSGLEAAQRSRILLIGQEGALRVPEGVRSLTWSGRASPAFAPAVAGPGNGRFMLEGLAAGVDRLMTGRAGALCFAPLNKSALRQAGMTQEDELRWFADRMAYRGVCGELNVLEKLWTSRVTSHVALREVSELIDAEKVAQSIAMIHRSLRAAGVARPRIGVCGLNPHNGDNGNYGDEEARLIEPGLRLAAERGFEAIGPFPADTAFVRAIRAEGGFDGVVTMYHDQGQIAMKLMGFERGVTVHGGLPWPITTPAHGTAYDIVGQGKAQVQAMRNAFDLACRMADGHRSSLPTTDTMETP